MQSSCFSPADRLSFDTKALSPPFSITVSYRLHYFSMSYISQSEYLPVMSRFYLKVDLMRVGYWSIIVMLLLSYLMKQLSILVPSINSYPSDISVILSKVLIMVVLPAPVRPTIPTFSPALIQQVTSLSASGRSILYLANTLLNSISPLWITSLQPSSLLFQLLQYSWQGASGSIFMKEQILSKEISLAQKRVIELVNCIISLLKLMAQFINSPPREAFEFSLNRQQPIAMTFTTKLKQVKLIENQLSIPAFVNLTLLFSSKTAICLFVNSCYILYARIVDSPLIADTNPETIGEFVDFQQRATSIWLFMKYFLTRWERYPTKTIGIMTQGVDPQMQIATSPSSRKILTSTLPILQAIDSSSSLRSLVSLLMILPTGTLLKKLPRLAQSNDFIICICTISPWRQLESTSLYTLKKMKRFDPRVSPTQIQRLYFQLGFSHHCSIIIEEAVVKQIHMNMAKHTRKAKLKYPPLSLIYYLKIVQSTYPTY